jgi:hypothetical protein
VQIGGSFTLNELTNIRLSIKKTYGPIDTSKSKFVQKNNSINITLTKDNNDYWSTLVAKGDKPV